MEKTSAKHLLRQSRLSALRAVPSEQRERFSALLREQLAAFLPQRGGAAVAVYAPLPHEVNLLPLLREQPQHRYLFPRCLPGRKLCFHYVTDIEHELQPGAHGILAPAASCPMADPQDIDILVVPGVAFTSGGKRLGYGGGYYDRFLPLCTHARILALAFPWQMVPDLPTEAHDLPIPQIITCPSPAA